MTDQWGFDPDANSFDQDTSNNKGLRQFAESVNKQNKELKDQLTSMQAELRKQQAVNTFEDLGLPRAAASLYSGDLTPDAINAWATQMRTVFGNAQPDAGQPAPDAAPVLTDQQQQTFQNLTQAGGNSIPSTSMDDHQRGVNNANSVQDLLSAWGQIR